MASGKDLRLRRRGVNVPVLFQGNKAGETLLPRALITAAGTLLSPPKVHTQEEPRAGRFFWLKTAEVQRW